MRRSALKIVVILPQARLRLSSDADHSYAFWTTVIATASGTHEQADQSDYHRDAKQGYGKVDLYGYDCGCRIQRDNECE